MIRPEVLGEGAVGAEHDDEALAALRCGCSGEAGEAGEEGKGGGGEAEVAEELAAREGHGNFGLRIGCDGWEPSLFGRRFGG